MGKPLISRGFFGKRRDDAARDRVPPGQYLTRDFPVLSAGPTPRIELADWRLTIDGRVDALVSWSWDEFQALPATELVADIHCVTKWSKLDTPWRGVSLDTLLERAAPTPEAAYVTAHCYGGYTTNLPLRDLMGGRALVAYEYDGAPLAPEHGGPARLLVPHLYLWKSAKWLRRLEIMATNRRGFWENLGYHNYGDPWKEQRYSGFDEEDG